MAPRRQRKSAIREGDSMAEPQTATMQGNGAEATSFQMLIQLVRQMGETSATLRSIDTGLTELRTNTTQQLAMLQERVGRSEALNDVQNERIKHLEDDRDALRREIAAVKEAHAREILKLKEDQREDDRTRWMIRGGLFVFTLISPALWEYVIVPLLAR